MISPVKEAQIVGYIRVVNGDAGECHGNDDEVAGHKERCVHRCEGRAHKLNHGGKGQTVQEVDEQEAESIDDGGVREAHNGVHDGDERNTHQSEHNDRARGLCKIIGARGIVSCLRFAIENHSLLQEHTNVEEGKDAKDIEGEGDGECVLLLYIAHYI